jgi:hypothetical protein
MIVNTEAQNKAFHPAMSEKTHPFYSDELRSIWQKCDRNWFVFSKKNMEVSF